MANARLFQFQYSYERDLVRMPIKITIGDTGAPTLTNGKGVVSVVRDSAGKYTITLKDNFNTMLAMSATINSGSSAPTAPAINVVSQDVTTAKTVVIQCRDIAAAAADPASGEIIMLELVMRNAST